MRITRNVLLKFPKPPPGSNWILYILYLLNGIYVFAGILAVGLGCRILFREESYFVAFLGYKIMTNAAIAIIISGILLVAVSLIGIVALKFRKRILILVYILLIAVFWFLLFFGGIAAALYKSTLGEMAKKRMIDGLLYQYRVNMTIMENAHMTEVWDRLQTEERCCSVEDNSWMRYQEALWYKHHSGFVEVDKPFVPKSCCVYDHLYAYLDLSKCQYHKAGPPGQQDGIYNRAVHYRGCYNASGQLGLDYFVPIAVVGLLSALIMIAGEILAVCFFRQLDAKFEKHSEESTFKQEPPLQPETQQPHYYPESNL